MIRTRTAHCVSARFLYSELLKHSPLFHSLLERELCDMHWMTLVKPPNQFT